MFSISPFGSCLLQEQPELARVLDLLLIANKYDAPVITRRARVLATSLTKLRVIKSNMVPPLSPFRLVEVGTITDSEEIASAG